MEPFSEATLKRGHPDKATRQYKSKHKYINLYP